MVWGPLRRPSPAASPWKGEASRFTSQTDFHQPRQLMRHKHSDYMHWSKTQSRRGSISQRAAWRPFPLRELPIDLKELEINGDDSYGYAPLQQAIAAHHGVDPDCVVESAGTSMANHLAMAAIIEPGDEVLIEHPAYGPILDVALLSSKQT